MSDVKVHTATNQVDYRYPVSTLEINLEVFL